MRFESLRRSVSIALVLLGSLSAFAQVPSSQHVVLVVDENTTFNNVMTYMPWLVAKGKANGYATNYHSDNSGSLMDYLWLASGSCHSSANCVLPPRTHNFNCSGDDCFYPGTTKADPITDNNIFREMNNAGISWKVYAEGYAQAGGTVTTPDNNNNSSYYRRHNAATWYSDVLSDVDGSASKIVDLSELSIDLKNETLPRYMIIIPDGNNDAHDCPYGMSTCSGAQQLAAADEFLRDTLSPILATPDFQPGGNGLVFVTFDECAGGYNLGCGASVYTAVIGPKVKPHTVSGVSYKHENTLRTMLDALGIRIGPGAAATAAPMFDFFTSSRPIVEVASPADNALVGGSMVIQASATPTPDHTVTGWFVYVDGVAKYEAGTTNTIDPTVSMSVGTHNLLVRAWDSSGAFGDNSFSVSVESRPVVTIFTPGNYVNVGAPVNLRAAAAASAGHAISGWWIYVDGIGTYEAGAANSINANLNLNTGTHTLLVRAWDDSGAYGDGTLTINVSDKPAVTISAPLPASSVASPAHAQAFAIASKGRKIAGWYVYLDGAAISHGGAESSISASVSAKPGQHTLLVRAWDSTGAYGDQTLSLQVK